MHIINKKEDCVPFMEQHHQNLYKGCLQNISRSKIFTVSLTVGGSVALVAAAISTWVLIGHIPSVLSFLNAFASLKVAGSIGLGVAATGLFVAALLNHKNRHPKLVQQKDRLLNSLLLPMGSNDLSNVALYKTIITKLTDNYPGKLILIESPTSDKHIVVTNLNASEIDPIDLENADLYKTRQSIHIDLLKEHR